jgi:hypothetical protein
MKMTQNEIDHKKIVPFLQKKIILVGSFLFLIPNMLFVFQGFSSRYWADDYCFSGFIKQFGFFNGLSAFYTTTSNRFSAFIFAGLSELFGSGAIRMLPGFVIISTGLLLYLLFNKLMELNHIVAGSKKSLLFSQITLFFILYLSPNIDQSIYWRSGLTHYFLPFPVLLFLLLIIYFPMETWEDSIVRTLSIFFLACFNAGLSESYAALQFGLFSIILFLSWICPWSKLRKRDYIQTGLVLLGTASAMALMILSPGNSLRLNSLQQAPNLFSIITISTSSAFDFIKFSIKGLWLPFGVLFALSILVANISTVPKNIKIREIQLVKILFFIVLITFGLIICVCAPTAYGMMAYPEQRVLMLAHIMLVLGITCAGTIIGTLLKKSKLNSRIPTAVKLVIVLLFCLYPLTSLKNHVEQISASIYRAKVWDDRNADILSQMDQGISDVTVRALDSFSEIAELSADDQFWVNQCAANYYGVDSISAVENK